MGRAFEYRKRLRNLRDVKGHMAQDIYQDRQADCYCC